MVYVFPAALPEVLWQHWRLSRLGVPAVVADAKYGTTVNYLYLGRLGIPTLARPNAVCSRSSRQPARCLVAREYAVYTKRNRFLG